MYKLYEVDDNFELSPSEFGEDLNKVATDELERKYVGMIDPDMGLILAIYKIDSISDGEIYAGDASTHHKVSFIAVTYKPEVNEINKGYITELLEFGAFAKIGPIDGLIHVSQITDDFISFDKKVNYFVSKNSNKTLKKDDVVYTKISTISLKKGIKDSRIALTMKPYGLGKLEWAEKVKDSKGKPDKSQKPKSGKGKK